MEAIDANGLLPEDASAASPIVLMVSGGSDSTALCLLAHELSQTGRIDPVLTTVLHVHHGLRGRDADGDALFVQKLASLCGFGFELRNIDIHSCLDEFDGNVENAGRFLRYELAGQLLDEMCQEAGVAPDNGRIWVAHTQDDRVETFFMRAIVGTGPGGLSSIRYRNGRVARPVLRATRDQLRDYVASRVFQLGWRLDDAEDAQVEGGLWREDATNYDTDGFRTFVRHELVPVAKLKNPSLGKTLARTMDLIADEDDMVQAHIERVRERAVRAEDMRVVLNLAEVGQIERPLMRRLLYSLCKDVLPYSKRIELKHIDLIMESMGRPGFAIDLPGGVRVRRECGSLVFDARPGDSGDAGKQAGYGAPGDVSLPVPGCAVAGGNMRVSVSRVEAPGGRNVAFALEHATSTTIFVDEDSLLAACGPERKLSISRRRDGDAMCPLGMGGAKKKLSDIFVDKKVPRRERDNVPIIRAGRSIVWAAGVATDERFKVCDWGTMMCIKIESIPQDKT